METDALGREEIVGRAIAYVLQGDDVSDDDGYGCAPTYLCLDDGTMFTLTVDDPDLESPLPRADLGRIANLREVNESIKQLVIGRRIREVVSSRYWPSPGLLLEGDILLIENACGQIVEVLVEMLGDKYLESDLVTYWGHRSIQAESR